MGKAPILHNDILDGGFVQLIDFMGDDNAVVAAARVSFLAESKGEEKDANLIDYLMRNHHTSPFEMAAFKFRVKAPLFIARQWMRHRTWSYNEVSRRYTSDEIAFYIPPEWRLQASSNKQGSVDAVSEGCQHFDGDFERWDDRVNDIAAQSLRLYKLMIANGVAREQARMVLPQSMYTTFYAGVDAHNLMNFLRLRRHPHAQYEMRLYADALHAALHHVLPVTAEAFDKYSAQK